MSRHTDRQDAILDTLHDLGPSYLLDICRAMDTPERKISPDLDVLATEGLVVSDGRRNLSLWRLATPEERANHRPGSGR